MSCMDSEIGKLITLYEFDALSDDDKRKFETHLLSCNHCFRSLYGMSPVVERMREHPEQFMPAVAEREPLWATTKKRFGASVSDWFEAVGRIPALVRIALPVAVTVTVLLFLIIPAEPHLSDLARIEPVPYRPMQMKAGALTTEADRLFEQGMALYTQEDYANAARKLALAVQRDSTDASFHFYSGLCYLLSGGVDVAIAHFQRAIALGGDSVLERAYWYLGNAWLLKGKRDSALEAFRKVAEMEGDYEWEAEEVVGKIEKLSQP